MKRNRIVLLFERPAGSKSLCFTLSPLFLYIVSGLLFLSWLVMGMVGCVGMVLYLDCLRLREANAWLQQKKIQLDSLRPALKRMEEDETIIRSFLGLEKPLGVVRGLGQGGDSVTLEFSSGSEGFHAIREIPASTQAYPRSILYEAEFLREKMRELVEVIREQRERMDHTPSIVPLDTQDYRFSSGFGWRRSPFTGAGEFHRGLDISAAAGARVIAPAKGKAVKIGSDEYEGNYLEIDHQRGCITTYAHLLSVTVTLSQEIERGEVIGLVGSTGRSTGPHVHYQIEVNGEAVDPMSYIFDPKANPLLEHRSQTTAVLQ